MAYERKTVDVWEVQQYSEEYGWECLTCELSRGDARANLRAYNENEPQYTHRIKHRRIPKERYARGDF